MSILDDAIREHLELKRAHGADEGELKRLEDEAFGPPQRPDEVDPFAEAPTEFLTSPGETAADAPAIGDEHERSGRRPDVADLQEAPSFEDAAASPSFFDAEAEAPPPPADEAPADLPPPTDEAPADLAPPVDEAPAAPPPSPEAPADAPPPAAPADEGTAAAPPAAAPADEGPELPAEEEHPAAEHEVVADFGPDTDERHAIADQPTQMFDVQAEMDAEAPPTPEDAVHPAPEDTAPYEQQPLDTRGPDAEVAGHPPAEAEPEEGSGEFDFFNEQRLSDELDQALEAPLPPTDEHLAMPRYEDAPAPEQGAIFDFESRGEPAAEEPAGEDEEAEDDEGETDYDPETGHEDVLEDTPRFLEDAEDDDLWFEQKPPKDFDLD